MQREIKFRVWDIYKKEFIPNNVFAITTSNFSYFAVMTNDWENYKNGEYMYPNAQTLMQFTGLEDKNGNEIYEGDIISKKEHREKSNWASEMVHNPDNYIEVAFVNGSFCNAYTERPLSDFLTSIVSKKVEYEVIGNVFENAEMLTVQPNSDMQCGAGG